LSALAFTSFITIKVKRFKEFLITFVDNGKSVESERLLFYVTTDVYFDLGYGRKNGLAAFTQSHLIYMYLLQLG